MAIPFYFNHLRVADLSLPDCAARLREHDDCWGVFAGLFGLSNRELYAITSEPVNSNPSWDLLCQQTWYATARPRDNNPLTKEGLYVFREFVIAPHDADELVSLSQQAWQTFETSTAYQTEPMALFKPANTDGGLLKMMLLTWYDNLNSWATSRQPDPQAQTLFRRRQALTTSSTAVATRLLAP